MSLKAQTVRKLGKFFQDLYRLRTWDQFTTDVIATLNRVKKDFNADDLALLDIMGPHLIQALGNTCTVTQMQEELATLNRMMEQLDRAVISITPSGRIRWATPRAQQFLSEYGLQGKRQTAWLPMPLRAWLKQQEAGFGSRDELPEPLKPLRLDRGSRTLQIRLIREEGHRLLCLDEHRQGISVSSLKPLGLSPRETEILSWVAQGKSNPEIGTILGISNRTVEKHLERIYVRLGLENRHAAITLTLETARR